MPHVLVVCEFATLNGGERSLLAVVPHLRQAGWEFDFLAPPDGPLAAALQGQGIEVVGRHVDLPKVLASRRVDLVHANSLATSLFAGPIAREQDVPSLGHLRDIVRLSGPKVARLNAHARLLAVSTAVRDHHLAQGLDPAKSHILHNGIDLRQFSSSPPTEEDFECRGIRAELHLSASAKLIGMIGQIILRKGQDTALTAVAPLMRDDRDLHAIVLGERHSEKPETVEYERKLHGIAAAAGVADRVHYLGTRDDVPTLLPQLDLLLHMARQEPLGRVLLEAAACGVPIVATDVGGTREIFPHEADDGALLVPVDDADAARAAVRRVIADAALARAMAIAGRRRIEAAFTVEQSAAGLMRHYNETAFGPHEPGCSLAMRD